MSRVPYRLMSVLATSALATGALLLSATASASATEAPLSGEANATAHEGNIKADDCATAGLAGSAIKVGSTDDGINITITSVPTGYTLTGVVVKGSPAYNVYTGDVRDKLHAPINASGGPAGISHWFACATKVGETVNGSTGNTAGGSAGEVESATAGGAAGSAGAPGAAGSAGTAGGAGTSGAGAAATGEDTAVAGAELADTGFSARVPLLVAGALLLIGAALVTATRLRARRNN